MNPADSKARKPQFSEPEAGYGARRRPEGLTKVNRCKFRYFDSVKQADTPRPKMASGLVAEVVMSAIWCLKSHRNKGETRPGQWSFNRDIVNPISSLASNQKSNRTARND